MYKTSTGFNQIVYNMNDATNENQGTMSRGGKKKKKKKKKSKQREDAVQDEDSDD